jgi:hypothetical protein
MRADRSLTPSRAAMVSMPTTLPEAVSSSHRRPLAIAARSFVLASARIGRAALVASLDDWITSRLRRKVCGDQGIAITLEGLSESPRRRISIERGPRVIRSTSAAIFSAHSAVSTTQAGLIVSGDCWLRSTSFSFTDGRLSMASRTIRSTASAATREIEPASSLRPWFRTEEM